VSRVASFLYRDALSSVRAVTGPGGGMAETAVYRPFGEQQERVLDASAAGEDKGFIGERYDADAGLQYLNARYYDPKLGLFLQPDWFEVTEPGVGTNRYSYSFNDPVNLSDPGGNAVETVWDVALIGYGAYQVGKAWWTEDDALMEQALTDLTVDALSAMAPGVPAGGSRAARMTGDAVQAGRRARGYEFTAATRREILERYGNGPGSTAHHIGEAGNGSAAARAVRDHLESNGIDLASAANGVGLVNHGQGRHRNGYSEIVLERTQNLSGREAIIRELRAIADELQRIDRELTDGTRRPRGRNRDTVREFVLDNTRRGDASRRDSDRDSAREAPRPPRR
jgi:RHS repeat-associated protein